MKQAEDLVTLELPLPLPVPSTDGDLFVPAPNWRRALDAAIASDPRGKLGVAERLGVSRPYVSRVATGHMPDVPAPFIERVQAVLMAVPCPHLRQVLQPQECRAFAVRSYSQIDQFEVAHWRACKSCSFNPASKAAAAEEAKGVEP